MSKSEFERDVAEVTGAELAFKVNLAAGVSHAKAILDGNAAVSRAAGRCASSPTATQEVLAQIQRLCSTKVDARYESPFDVPLAGLLMVLQKARSPALGSAVAMIDSAENTWWAHQIATELRPQPDRITTDDDAQTPVEIVWVAPWVEKRKVKLKASRATAKDSVYLASPDALLKWAPSVPLAASSSSSALLLEPGRGTLWDAPPQDDWSAQSDSETFEGEPGHLAS